MEVSRLRYTQPSIKREFHDGRQFSELIDDFMSGKVDPGTLPKMVLEVIERDGRFFFPTTTVGCSASKGIVKT